MSVEQTQEQTIFSDVGGWLCLDFTNTVQGYALHGPTYDYFQSYSDLALWARQAGLITQSDEVTLRSKAESEPAEAEIVLARARELREAMHRVFGALSVDQTPSPDAMDCLNEEIRQSMGKGQLEMCETGCEWRWPAFPHALDSLLWPIAKSAADLLTSEKLERVRECAGDSCGWLFIDASKNHSRRWCDMRDCGNSAKARRHYQRKKALK